MAGTKRKTTIDDFKDRMTCPINFEVTSKKRKPVKKTTKKRSK